MHLYVRADANGKIGTGHIMRCIALAQTWQDSEGEVTFISHCESNSIKERIIKEGFGFVSIEYPHPHSSDLAQTVCIIDSKKSNDSSSAWLVLDGYHFTPEYQKAIHDTGNRLLVIDDMNHLPQYHADILLNQNIHAPDLNYCHDEDTILLLGNQYVLLRREFQKYRDFKRRTPDRAKNILVTLGGADPDNVTSKIIEALNLLNGSEIKVRIIIGPANPHQELLSQSLSSSFGAFELLINPPDMPELMAWADLAISAAGSTCWELAFMGVSVLLFILSKNQEPIAVYLSKTGAAKNLGWQNRCNFIELSHMLFSLISDFKMRKTMSDNNKLLIDGMGCVRIYNYMIGSQSIGRVL